MRQTIVNTLLVAVGATALACVAQESGVWLDVPFVKQGKNGSRRCQHCDGHAVLAAPAGLAPTAVPDAPDIQLSSILRSAHGIYASDLERYFEQHRYRAFAFAGRVQDLQDHLAKGRPA